MDDLDAVQWRRTTVVVVVMESRRHGATVPAGNWHTVGDSCESRRRPFPVAKAGRPLDNRAQDYTKELALGVLRDCRD